MRLCNAGGRAVLTTAGYRGAAFCGSEVGLTTRGSHPRSYFPVQGKERGWPTHDMTHGDTSIERPSPQLTYREQIRNCQAFSVGCFARPVRAAFSPGMSKPSTALRRPAFSCRHTPSPVPPLAYHCPKIVELLPFDDTAVPAPGYSGRCSDGPRTHRAGTRASEPAVWRNPGG